MPIYPTLTLLDSPFEKCNFNPIGELSDLSSCNKSTIRQKATISFGTCPVNPDLKRGQLSTLYIKEN